MDRRLSAIEPEIGIRKKIEVGSDVHTGIIKSIVNTISWRNSFASNNLSRWEKNRKLYYRFKEESMKKEDEDKEKQGQLGELIFPLSYKIIKTILDISLEEMEKRRYYYELLPYTAIDYPKVLFLNILLQNELKKQNYLMQLKQVLEDTFIYGCGIFHITWGKVYQDIYNETTIVGDKILDIPTQKIIEKTKKIVYEGNNINVINPSLFDFDKSFGILDVDKWRYCLIRSLIGIDDLINIVSNSNEFVNVELLRELATKNTLAEFMMPVVKATGDLNPDEAQDLELWWKQGRKVLIESIYIKINPKRLGLTDDDDSEIWLFTVVNRRLIIKASPMTYNHNVFPIAIYTWNSSYNEKYPTALLDYLEPLQAYVDWLLEKYRMNVNASINRMFVINADLLENPEEFQFDRALSIIKLDPRKVRTMPDLGASAIRELNFDLKTSAHLNVLPLFIDVMKLIAGISDIHLGQIPRGRRTYGEAQLQALLTSTGMRSLLRNLHNVIGNRVSRIITSNLRQFLQGNVLIEIKKDEFEQVKRVSDIARNLETLETLMGRQLLNLDVNLIKGDYDFYLGDYLEPSYDEKTLQALTQILAVVGNIPPLAQQLAMGMKLNKFVELLFRLAGVKNPEDYILPEAINKTLLELQAQQQQQQKIQ